MHTYRGKGCTYKHTNMYASDYLLHAQNIEDGICSHTECTHTCSHWIGANGYLCIRGGEKENCLLCFLGLYFWKRSRNTGTSGFPHCLSLRLFKNFFFSWPPYSRDQSHEDIAGTCSCPPLLLRLEFSFDRQDVFWSSLFWLVSRLSWWGWKREEEERASWS